ncbi:hypothetical protein G9A89_001722 [Geosiphon pyriformis]|nr:hypothetical protein G9A89_001722 [Geosiphon pyriformis]
MDLKVWKFTILDQNYSLSNEPKKNLLDMNLYESVPGRLSKKHRSFAARQLEETVNKRKKDFPMFTRNDFKLRKTEVQTLPTVGISDAVFQIKQAAMNLNSESQIGKLIIGKENKNDKITVKTSLIAVSALSSPSPSQPNLQKKKTQMHQVTFEDFMRKVYPHAQKDPPKPVPITPFDVSSTVKPFVFPENESFIQVKLGKPINFTNNREEIDLKGKRKAR